MQAANTIQGQQRDAVRVELSQSQAVVGQGPMPISPELLQLVSGGKTVGAAAYSTAAPRNGW